MAKSIQNFSPRSVERIGKTVARVLGDGGSVGLDPFQKSEVPTYLKIVSSEYNGTLHTPLYTVDTYASPLAGSPLKEDVLAIDLLALQTDENEVAPLPADTWVRMIDMFYIGSTWYLIFNSGSRIPAPGLDYQVLISIGGNWAVDWPLTFDSEA